MVVPAVDKLPITVLIATKNEAKNIQRCLSALSFASAVILLDSESTDGTLKLARELGAEIIQFHYQGGYPKKRQWALANIPVNTPWILLVDADEMVPLELWQEIAQAIRSPQCADAFLITKGFHFLGRRFRFGCFSHAAVALFKYGKARFERLFEDTVEGLDMEVHERLIVEGAIGHLRTPLIHEDFKGLEAYLHRHNKYSTWEAHVRLNFLISGRYGQDTIKPKLFGNSQERRRFLKSLAIRVPGEAWFWFCYHYFLCLGILEGRAGFIASQIRSQYIAQVHAKVFELQLLRKHNVHPLH